MVEFQMEGKGWCGVGEGSDGDDVDAGLGDGSDRRKGDPAAGFEYGFAMEFLDDFGHDSREHIVEEDDIGTGVDGFGDLLGMVALYFDFVEVRDFVAGCLDGGGD